MLSAPPELPTQLTSFVGREREVDQVRTTLLNGRLVTLTGPGGIGKTRLALEVARGSAIDFPSGVWLVQLAPIADPLLVPSVLAAELGIKEAPPKPLLETVTVALRARRLLLVLDNCEHLVQAAAEVAHTLLRACPGVRILATSRETLNIPGETVWPVPSLSLPTPDAHDALNSEAVRLFRDRARSALPAFELNGRTVDHVAEVCRQLEGIPLAIELAAARLRVLGVDQIAARLHDRFRLLTSGYRTAAPRHQTLRAVLDWSHDLLTEPERMLLRRLSVFAGGFTIDAVESVCGGESPFETLASLVNKSLVLARPEGRFLLLETVRQYAAERLVSAAEEAATQHAHLVWCLDLAHTAESELRGARQAEWLDRLELEHENMRAALRWGLEGRETPPLTRAPRGLSPEGARRYETDSLAPHGERAGVRGEADLAAVLQLASALWWFWRERGYASEGRRWLERALDAADRAPVAPEVRGRALDAVGALAHSQGAYAPARTAVEAALTIWRAQGDRQGAVASLNTLGIVAKAEGDHERAATLLREALAEARALGDRGRVATALNNLAALALDQSDYAGSRELLLESLALKRELGDRVGIVAALHNLGESAYHLGSFEEAARLLEEGVALSRTLGATHRSALSLHSLGMTRLRLGDEAGAIADLGQALGLFRDMGDEWGVTLSLEGLAQAAATQRGNPLAVHLFAAAGAWRAVHGSPVPPNDRADYERSLNAARELLGQVAFDRAWTVGSVLTLADAIVAALALQPAATPAAVKVEAAEQQLSPREREVAGLVAHGLTNRQIAAELGISKATVDRHVSNILVKRGFASRSALAAWVARAATS